LIGDLVGLGTVLGTVLVSVGISGEDGSPVADTGLVLVVPPGGRGTVLSTVDSVVSGVVGLTLASESVPFFSRFTSVNIRNNLRAFRLDGFRSRNVNRGRSGCRRNVNRGRSGCRRNVSRLGSRGRRNIDRLLSGLINLFRSFSFKVALSVHHNSTPVALADAV